MKKIKYIVIAALIGLGMSGCEDMLYDNVNPDKPNYIVPEQSLPVVIFYASQIVYDHGEYHTYLSQALTTGGRAAVTGYPYKSGWEFLSINRHPQWRRHFFDIGANINELIRAAEIVDSKNFILIARTIRLMSTQMTTDAFGEMPLREAYLSDSPAYDSQESIYEWMLTEADELLKLYDDKEWTENPKNVEITIGMDRIFAGDLKKWKQFTHALKARILLRKLPNWDNTNATCQQIINAVDAALADWEEPVYNYDGGNGVSNNPWGSAQPIINGWESRDNRLNEAVPSKFLCVDMMGVYESRGRLNGWAEDPRLEKFMTPRSGPTDATLGDTGTKFRYLQNNIGMDASYKVINYPDLYECVLTKNDGYISLFMTEELLLIKAEALYWQGKKNEARNITVEAVELSFDRFGVDTKTYRDNYIIGNAANTNGVDLKDKYLPEGNSFTIGHLMRQKYICMYLQPEQWTDMRRYNYSNNTNQITYDGVIIYPTLRRPFNLYEPFWFTNPNEQEWIYRINVDPDTEDRYNRPALEELGAYKNPEWLKKPMIWAIRK